MTNRQGRRRRHKRHKRATKRHRAIVLLLQWVFNPLRRRMNPDREEQSMRPAVGDELDQALTRAEAAEAEVRELRMYQDERLAVSFCSPQL